MARTNETLAHRAQMARSLRDRLVGLLGRSVLPEGEGLILLACRSIHTVCMRFAIDAVFVDGRWRVLRICKALPPWRMSPIVWRATAVIELPAGAAQQAHLAVGDRLVLQPVLEQNPLDKASASQVDFE
ncbi:MAG: DUF192 domain-containing protein [Candidatus Omnitrophota bacterium]|nr:DUF192 domain-containing protein [Candidatus Omnitrophota bacterium]